MGGPVIQETKGKMGKAAEALKAEFARFRTGRASPALLEGILVEYYGSQLPINQVGSIAVQEGRTLVITPWDKGALAEIEKSIQKSDLGLTPVNDGKVVRINLPTPNEERRKEMVKQAKKMAEEARVTVRNIRRDSNELIKKIQKEGTLSEDDLRKGETEIQKLTDQFISQLDQLLAHKEKEILEV